MQPTTRKLPFASSQFNVVPSVASRMKLTRYHCACLCSLGTKFSSWCCCSRNKHCCGRLAPGAARASSNPAWSGLVVVPLVTTNRQLLTVQLQLFSLEPTTTCTTTTMQLAHNLAATWKVQSQVSSSVSTGGTTNFVVLRFWCFNTTLFNTN